MLVSTGTDRQKYRNVCRDPRVSVLLVDPDDPYRYLERRGRVVEIEQDPDKAFLDRLAHKYLGQDTYPVSTFNDGYNPVGFLTRKVLQNLYGYGPQ